MFKNLILLSAVGALALAQEDPDIPPQFKNLITPETYHQMRDDYINLLRGMPADPELRDQAIQKMLQQQSVKLSGNLVGGPALVTWKPLGPGPIPNGQTQGVTKSVSGRATAIAIDPLNENKVYVGTAQGGVYRTLDGAATWTQIFDNNKTSAIGALALDSLNGRLYVGTGEPNGSADSFAGVGLFRIDNVNGAASQVGPINPVRSYNDAASNPQSIAVFTGRSISSIVIVPNDPTTLLVGTAGGVIGSGGDSPFGGSVPPLGLRGLYKLTNVTGAPAGVSVLRIGVRSGAGNEGCFDTPCTGNRNVNSIVLDPGDVSGNTLLLWLNGTSAANDGGVWRTTNALAATPTFTRSFGTTSTSTSNGRGELRIYKEGANAAVVYAASGEPSTGTSCTSTGSNQGAMRVSTDGGVTFSASKLNGSGGFCGGQCFYNIGVDVLPGSTTAQTDDIVLLGGNVRSVNNCTRLGAKSTDGGSTFSDSATSGLHADTHFIKIAPSNSNVVYHGNDGGVFKSTDGGVTWASVNPGINSVQFSGLAVHPTSANFTIGGTQDNGTNHLLADGTTWNRIDFGDGGYAMIDQSAVDTSNVTMYHTYFNSAGAGGLLGYARVDTVAAAFDANWGFFGCNGSNGNGITCTDTAALFYAPLGQGPGSPNTVYYGSDRLYRSTDKGVNNAVVSQAPISSGVPISSIAISPQDDGYRLVGQSNGGLYYTTSGSSTLTNLDPANTIPNKFVGRVMFDPASKNTAYVALGGYMASTTAANSHIWKVTSLNTTPVFTAGTGVPDVPVNAIAVDPSNGNNVYVGTDIGVYQSTDGGATFLPYGTGLPVVSVFDAKIQPTSGVLRIATHGRGMWETTPAPAGGATALASIINGKTGSLPGVRTWTIQVSNQGPAAANATQITSLALSLAAGPACAPTVVSPLPVFVGSIPNGGNASAGVAINFPSGCSSMDRFTVNIGVSANSGNATATSVRNNERP